MTKSSTDYPNIVWDEVHKRFRAYLTMRGDRTLLGYFQSPEDAAMARRQAAQDYVQSFVNHD